MDEQYLWKDKLRQAAADFSKRKRQVADDYRMGESTKTKQLTAKDLKQMAQDALDYKLDTIESAERGYLQQMASLYNRAKINGLLRNGFAPWHDDYPVD